MDLRKYVKVIHGSIHDPSIKLIANMDFISKKHQQLEEQRVERVAQKRKESELKLCNQPEITVEPEKEVSVAKPVNKRGCYNKYSEETRTNVSKWAMKWGIPSTFERFSAHNQGKGIFERTSKMSIVICNTTSFSICCRF